MCVSVVRFLHCDSPSVRLCVHVACEGVGGGNGGRWGGGDGGRGGDGGGGEAGRRKEKE